MICSFMLHDATGFNTFMFFTFFCSDTIRLQQQLEELQIRLVTLEKKAADNESMQAELEEKKVCPKLVFILFVCFPLSC